jgi:hypothetical protein
MRRLPSIVVSAALLAAASAARADWPPPTPATIELTVQDAFGLPRPGAIARGGVPLARSQDLRDVSRAQLVDAAGQPVPAQFRVLARWNAGGGDTSAPVQWLLVDAAAPAAGQALRLRLAGPVGGNPAPAVAVQVTQAQGRYTVDTGAARFVVDPAGGALFSELRAGDGRLLATGRPAALRVDGVDVAPSAVRFARVDESGPLAAMLTVEWTTTAPALGGGGVSLRRQYRFEAGSPTAVVRSALAWEGERCGNAELRACAAGVNGRRVALARDALLPAGNGARSLRAWDDVDLAPASANVPVGAVAALRQLRRSDRLQPLAYTLQAPGVSRGGSEADAGVFALSTAGTGAVGVGLSRMDHFEPQALRVLAGGEVAVDWVDDPGVWIGNRQAVYATLAVSALPEAPATADLERALFGPLSAPLRLWARPAQFAASQAVPEFPLGALPPAYAGYDALVTQTLQATVTRFDSRGLRGLMSTGVWPSYWGTPFGEQIECGAGDDPTPAEDWDDAYWCPVWTDYHNASSIGTLAAMRAGEPFWFDRITLPAAQRMLHSVAMQCAPDDPWPYCGQAPAGGGGYRANFNSSHAYFEGLVLYHFLTGDPWVTDTLARGAAGIRGYLCPARASSPPGPMCAPTTPGTDDFVQINDRAANQWYEVFRVLGQGVDASYLDDWRGNIARWLSLHWAQGTDAQGAQLGFIVPSGVGNGLSILAPGPYTTSQLWMASGYDFEQLARLRVATGDTALGSPALAPSAVIAGWGRTLRAAATRPPGDGTAAGVIPNALDFTWAGSRIGGTISGVGPAWLPGPMPESCLDECLYDTGKGFMTATLARAADFSGDPAQRALADDFVRHTIQRATAADLPLGKESAELLVRLPSAVARLSTVAAGEPPLFADGFEP